MKIQNKKLTYQILKTLATGALISAAILAPGMAHVLKEFQKWEKFDQRRLKDNLKRLKKQKMIGIKQVDGEAMLVITKKGSQRLLKYNIDNLKINNPKKWDGFFRIVIFDIPEKKKIARETLRNKLKELGFLKLQRSVFIHPYPCKKEIEFIINIYEIYPYVNYIVAKKIGNELQIRNHFCL